MNTLLAIHATISEFFNLPLGHGFGIELKVGKLVGYLGALMFAGRWFVQLLASRVSGRPVMPRTFWYMSLAGSLLVLFYFVFGKNDSVGIMANLFPFLVAAYNLFLDHNHRKSRG